MITLLPVCMFNAESLFLELGKVHYHPGGRRDWRDDSDASGLVNVLMES